MLVPVYTNWFIKVQHVSSSLHKLVHTRITRQFYYTQTGP